MSSPSKPYPCDAVVCRSGTVTGPIRLPMKDSQLFIDAFNRLYHGAGLSIVGPLSANRNRSSLEKANDPADRHG